MELDDWNPDDTQFTILNKINVDCSSNIIK